MIAYPCRDHEICRQRCSANELLQTGPADNEQNDGCCEHDYRQNYKDGRGAGGRGAEPEHDSQKKPDSSGTPHLKIIQKALNERSELLRHNNAVQ